jgi:hypothetical protein
MLQRTRKLFEEPESRSESNGGVVLQTTLPLVEDVGPRPLSCHTEGWRVDGFEPSF